eukprot:579572-Alexandrium_andersonii.AAC.1
MLRALLRTPQVPRTPLSSARAAPAKVRLRARRPGAAASRVRHRVRPPPLRRYRLQSCSRDVRSRPSDHT